VLTDPQRAELQALIDQADSYDMPDLRARIAAHETSISAEDTWHSRAVEALAHLYYIASVHLQQFGAVDPATLSLPRQAHTEIARRFKTMLSGFRTFTAVDGSPVGRDLFQQCIDAIRRVDGSWQDT
jgi:hypothetical protein